MLSRAIWALFFKHSDKILDLKNIVDPILGGPWIRHCNDPLHPKF